jgi:hypothetical protein
MVAGNSRSAWPRVIAAETAAHRPGATPMSLNLEMKGELLRLECVLSHLEQHGGRRTELLSAIDGLASLPEVNSIETASASFTSTATAICHGVKIFVSYKIGHGRAARALLEPFSLFGNGRILFDDSQKWPFLCELAGLQGRPYKDLVHAALEETHWFFLLLPDAAIDRGWVMFEAGFFLRSMQPGDRLICIHHPSVTPAGPLEDFSRVTATPEDLLRMYRTLLCEPGAIPGMDAINARLSDDYLKPHVTNLIELIQPTPELKRRYYVSFVDIRLDQRHPIVTRDDLLSADIVAGNNVDRIFGSALVVSQRVLDESRVERPQLHPGSTLRNVLGQDSDLAEQIPWLDGMARVLAAVFMGREPPPVEALIRGADHKFYQPVLETVRQRSYDGALVSAHITFQEKINTPILRAPRNLEALATALRLGYRFRWEIIEEFRNVESAADVALVERLIQRMEQEGRERNLSRPEDMPDDDLRHLPVVRAFPTSDQAQIIEIYKQWSSYRNAKGDGRLDKAFKRRDPNEVASCLEELDKMNRTFMRLGARQYARIVEFQWADII